MPTSSITKDFVIEDEKVFARLLEEIDKSPENNDIYKSESLEKGHKLLKNFIIKKQSH